MYRVTSDGSWSGHMATCAAGAEHDRKVLGVDHTSAVNPLAELVVGVPFTLTYDDLVKVLAGFVADGGLGELDAEDVDLDPVDVRAIVAARLARTGADDVDDGAAFLAGQDDPRVYRWCLRHVAAGWPPADLAAVIGARQDAERCPCGGAGPVHSSECIECIPMPQDVPPPRPARRAGGVS